jgi:hypothetical protein
MNYEEINILSHMIDLAKKCEAPKDIILTEPINEMMKLMKKKCTKIPKIITLSKDKIYLNGFEYKK